MEQQSMYAADGEITRLGKIAWRSLLGEIQEAMISGALSDEDIVARLSKRRVCVQCGEIVRIVDGAADTVVCPKCGGALITSPDDAEDVVRKRITQQGNEALKPIIEFYKDREVYEHVDGRLTIDEVEEQIEKVLNK